MPLLQLHDEIDNLVHLGLLKTFSVEYFNFIVPVLSNGDSKLWCVSPRQILFPCFVLPWYLWTSPSFLGLPSAYILLLRYLACGTHCQPFPGTWGCTPFQKKERLWLSRFLPSWIFCLDHRYNQGTDVYRSMCLPALSIFSKRPSGALGVDTMTIQGLLLAMYRMTLLLLPSFWHTEHNAFL